MSTTNPDPNELMALERETYRRYQVGDIDGLMDMLAENAQVCPPGMDAIFGRDNQRALFKQIAATPGVELYWEPIEAHISASNDMGYVYGSVNWKMPGEDLVQGKYISIWTRVDGQWMNAVEIRNANA
ncbi:MAG: DUF4440 domain-containing protein [Gammaproteobacteria bacterium]